MKAKKTYLAFGLLCACFSLAACDPVVGQTANGNVWNNYDVRHPVPADSRVPDKYARQYDTAVDNDIYYSQPFCSGGFDSPACVNSTY